MKLIRKNETLLKRYVPTYVELLKVDNYFNNSANNGQMTRDLSYVLRFGISGFRG